MAEEEIRGQIAYRLRFAKFSVSAWDGRHEWQDIYNLDLPTREPLVRLAAEVLRLPGVVAVEIKEVKA